MTRAEVRKGMRVTFRDPENELVPLYDPSQHKLVGMSGTIVGINEDIWCYPDDSASNIVWVACDFMPMNLIYERPEMFEQLIYDSTKSVFEYYGLPFDVEPPQ